MQQQPKGIDLAAAYRIIIQAYIRNHSLVEGQKVQFSRDQRAYRIQWTNAVIVAIGPGPWDDRMVRLQLADGMEEDVHSEQLRVLP